MPRIIPIRDLKKASEISQMCREYHEPIYVTKNGYGNMERFRRKAFWIWTRLPAAMA
jgi:hypothetical protein